jgi:signal transduction histidine kinase/CheY-like chemotaxis protein
VIVASTSLTAMQTPAQPSRPFRPSRFSERFGHELDPALRQEVANEQLRMVLGHTRLGTYVATAFALLLALQLRGDEVAAWIVDGWLVAKLGVAGARIHLSLRYERLRRPGGHHWHRLTDAWLLADGIVWGVAAFALVSAAMALTALVSAVMACVSCVATFGLQFSKRSTAAYVVPILTLTALGLLRRGDEFGTLGGIGLLMLLGLLLATAVASEKRLVEMLTLRLRAQALSIEKDEALKLALRQSAVKTQFIGNVSHELRTPLHGILGVARVLQLQNKDAAVSRRLQLIESSGSHLLGLINDLLDISRIEAGQFVIRTEVFELGALVRNLADLYTVRCTDKGLEFMLTQQLDPPCWVSGDPARVRQVLHNLLGNAVKFTQRGSVGLNLSYDSASGRLSAEVQDTGPGIDASDLPRVFEAFHQAAAGPRPFQGTGLGLTIARDIAQALGGDITMTSTVGIGTCASFTALLPPAPAPRAAPAAPRPAADAPAASLRALIAEDDEVNALIATAYLEHFGLSAERVSDGQQAVVQALREIDRPELILMDCRMPNLDGMAATREIRAAERSRGLKRVPVIALTATTSDINRQLCVNAGMDDFMTKPYTRDELLRMLQRWAPGQSRVANGSI